MATQVLSKDSEKKVLNIAVIGAGTIGLSFAALHLSGIESTRIIIYDIRPDLRDYIETKLSDYLSTLLSPPAKGQTAEAGKPKAPPIASLIAGGRLRITSSLAEAVIRADIIQEQGPERVEFKRRIWSEIETLAPPNALFWTSTSGILASLQSQRMLDKSRLIVVHPFNPPHIMPLLEIVQPPRVELEQSERLTRTMDYWSKLGRKLVVLKQEITGFVANRLSFALLREAVYLIERGTASVEDIDQVVQQSLRPRWAVRGPFWSYHAGGGEELGLKGFLDKVGDTIQDCWDDLGQIQLRPKCGENPDVAGWKKTLCDQVQDAYGQLKAPDLIARDEKLQDILGITCFKDISETI